jgi:hypothetical protein
MADTKQSPPRQTVEDFVRKSPSEAPGPAHPCDAPGLSPIEFLQAIYRDRTLPMSIRIDAARGLLPYTEPRPARIPLSDCKIIISPLSYEPWSEVCSPWPRSTAGCSQNPSGSHIPTIQGADPPDPVNLTTDPEPYSPDYSSPPDPHIFELARKWGLPEPLLCSYCGHWLTITYPDCICGPGNSGERDKSKMN